jgi:protoporphyrinogen oxidase
LNKTEKIAVLGAGPMGLAVAYQLALDGHQPIIFEADDRLGGMAAPFDFSGTWIERYYHFHCISDHAFLKALDELGLSEKMHWVPTKMGYWYLNQLQAWGNPWALLKFKGLGFIAKMRYAIHVFISAKRNDWQGMDKEDAVTWVKRWVGPEAYEVLWRKLFEYKFYEYTPNLSAAWIWSRVRRIGRSRYDLFQEKLGYLEGGSDTLLQAMRKAIEERGGKFYLRTPAEQILLKDGAVAGVMANGLMQSFDKIVSTIPLPYVAKICPQLPENIRMQYEAKKNIAVVCVIAKLAKPVTHYFWLNTNDDEMDIPGIIEYSNLRPMDDHIVYAPFYMPGEHPKYQDSNEQFALKVKTYLQKINPQLSDADFIDIHVSRYRFAQPICPPRYLETLPPIELPIKGLWVADTSYYYPEDRGISESVDLGRKMAKMAEGS